MKFIVLCNDNRLRMINFIVLEYKHTVFYVFKSFCFLGFMLAYKVQERNRLARLANLEAVAEEEARLKKKLEQKQAQKRKLRQANEGEDDEVRTNWDSYTKVKKFIKLKNEANAF